ncbi:hypothetical protein [Clavibacter sp. VKM Ac-2872]|uniref:hypothetical protein n=1 Tax=Clavibacter sp. VKM Ac-2872 TaxID=2783812 RepID=UPI00188BA773|nr:hypothetical protein [Clavibacter sp. VKM Ac-2872]MBF4625529.1 hypothetical protein [Clavibacter sp. VKM Ac-2872]
MNKRQELTIGEAAERVHRTRRTIQFWMNRDGMRFHWKRGKKMIRLDDLLLHYRKNLIANPNRKRPEGSRKKSASGG